VACYAETRSTRTLELFNKSRCDGRSVACPILHVGAERERLGVPSVRSTGQHKQKDPMPYVAVTEVRSHVTTKSSIRHKITVYFVILRHCIKCMREC